MSNRQNEHSQLEIIHLINDPIIAHSNSIQIRFARELHATRRARILFKIINRVRNLEYSFAYRGPREISQLVG
jgi:hypothetical protein